MAAHLYIVQTCAASSHAARGFIDGTLKRYRKYAQKGTGERERVTKHQASFGFTRFAGTLPSINFVVRMTKCTLRASASATDTSPAKTARQKVRAHSQSTAHASTAPTVHTAQQRKDSKRAASRRGSTAQPQLLISVGLKVLHKAVWTAC